jgi:hypothetical protein
VFLGHAGDDDWTRAESSSAAGRRLSKFAGPANKAFGNLPGVAEVEILIPVGRPTHRIVHIADWHFVPRNAFAADIRDQFDDAIADEEIDQLYAKHLGEVQHVQAAQRQLLRELIRRHGLKQVFCEGLTESEMPVYSAIINHLRRRGMNEHGLLAGWQGIDEAALRVGAAGQLLAIGELCEVVPAEDEPAFERANPFAGDRGEPVFDGPANAARQAAIVQRMLESGPVAVIVLGGGHDLSKQVRQLGGGQCEYVKVTPQNWPDGDGDEVAQDE